MQGYLCNFEMPLVSSGMQMHLGTTLKRGVHRRKWLQHPSGLKDNAAGKLSGCQ